MYAPDAGHTATAPPRASIGAVACGAPAQPHRNERRAASGGGGGRGNALGSDRRREDAARTGDAPAEAAVAEATRMSAGDDFARAGPDRGMSDATHTRAATRQRLKGLRAGWTVYM